MSISLNYFLLFSIQLFIIGMAGIVATNKNVLFMLISVEIMLLAANVLLILTATCFSSQIGMLFALFVLTIAAAESAIGLSLIILFYKFRGTIGYPFINLIKS